MDDQVLIEIQRQIGEVGQTAARMEEKLNVIMEKTERNSRDIDAITCRLNTELVPRTTITRMGEELAEMGKLVRPAQKATRWVIRIAAGILGAAGTVYVVRILADMTRTLSVVLDTMGGKP
jgi:hypothetical protein